MSGAVEILKRERDQANDEIRSLRARLRDLDNAILILEGQASVPRATTKSEGDLKARVLEMIVGAETTGITPKAVAQKLTALGRATSEASVSSTLSRLKTDEKVRNNRGLWFAVAAAPHEASAAFDQIEDIEEESPFEDERGAADDDPW